MALKTYAFFSTETYLLPGLFDDTQHEKTSPIIPQYTDKLESTLRVRTKETFVRWDKFRQA
jgi:hypothetical protein